MSFGTAFSVNKPANAFGSWGNNNQSNQLQQQNLAPANGFTVGASVVGSPGIFGQPHTAAQSGFRAPVQSIGFGAVQGANTTFGSATHGIGAQFGGGAPTPSFGATNFTALQFGGAAATGAGGFGAQTQAIGGTLFGAGAPALGAGFSSPQHSTQQFGTNFGALSTQTQFGMVNKSNISTPGFGLSNSNTAGNTFAPNQGSPFNKSSAIGGGTGFFGGNNNQGTNSSWAGNKNTNTGSPFSNANTFGNLNNNGKFGLSPIQTAQVIKRGTQGLNFAQIPHVDESITTRDGRPQQKVRNLLFNVSGFEECKNKSQEELRFEDLQPPQNTNSFGLVNNVSVAGFGAPTNPFNSGQGNMFGAQAGAPQATNPLQTSPAALVQGNAGSLFGANAFASPGFNGGASQGQHFGASAQQQQQTGTAGFSAFGGANFGNQSFSSPPQQQQQSAFGAQGGSPAGNFQLSTPQIGAAASFQGSAPFAFGTPSAGQAQATGTGFGFGSSSGFGAPAATSTSGFGSTNMFGLGTANSFAKSPVASSGGFNFLSSTVPPAGGTGLGAGTNSFSFGSAAATKAASPMRQFSWGSTAGAAPSSWPAFNLPAQAATTATASASEEEEEESTEQTYINSIADKMEELKSWKNKGDNVNTKSSVASGGRAQFDRPSSSNSHKDRTIRYNKGYEMAGLGSSSTSYQNTLRAISSNNFSSSTTNGRYSSRNYTEESKSSYNSKVLAAYGKASTDRRQVVINNDYVGSRWNLLDLD